MIIIFTIIRRIRIIVKEKWLHGRDIGSFRNDDGAGKKNFT